ncbi:MAG: hypothetical protein RSA29_04535 [Clostridium sp.]
MGKVIHYEDVAIEWCRIQEVQMEIGIWDNKLYERITKIFQWDLKLNLIC